MENNHWKSNDIELANWHETLERREYSTASLFPVDSIFMIINHLTGFHTNWKSADETALPSCPDILKVPIYTQIV